MLQMGFFDDTSRSREGGDSLGGGVNSVKLQDTLKLL